MNWKVISRNIGLALLVSALFMFLSVIVSIAEGNDSALAALAISFTITFIVGIFPFIFVRKTDVISLKEGYVIITLSWLMSFIFGMLPYALWGGPFTLANAWFESVSGFTTCGATILENVEALPKSLLFWRASTHFIGGLGVVVFLLLVIPESSPMRMRLTNMELTSLSRSGYSSRTNKVVYIFAYVYLALCGIAVIAYLLAGMSFFDAVCHAMSVVPTGGFSTRNLSIASFDSRLIEGITMVLMYLASLHFGVLYATWPFWMVAMLSAAGLICGCAGSTASGIKVDRLIILFKSIGRYVNNILHPNSVNEVRLGKRILRDEEVSPHLLYIGLYAVVIVVSTLLVLCTGTDPANSLVGTISSLANIGPASGDMGNLGNFNHLPTLSKFIFSVDMFLGRIEIYPVLAVLGMMLTKRNR